MDLFKKTMKRDIRLLVILVTGFILLLLWINHDQLENISVTTNIFLYDISDIEKNNLKGKNRVTEDHSFNKTAEKNKHKKRNKVRTSHKLSVNFNKLHDENFRKNHRKLILIATPLFGILPWPRLPYDYKFTALNGELCEVSECVITYDKSKIWESDALYFHGRDLPSPQKLRKMRMLLNNSKQVWIWVMHESPQYTYYEPTDYNWIFNWTASYRKASDIYIPYSYVVPLEDKTKGKLINYAQKKNRFILTIISNCATSRIKLVQKLGEYVKVDVFGNCAKLFNSTKTCPRSTKSCEQIKARYKFYLAFENSLCPDYVTEKYYSNAKNHIVPVLFTGANHDHIGLPKNSYVDARAFKNVQELAYYLRYLDRNDTAYNEYHKWAQDYKFESKRAMCEVCKTLWERENFPGKSIDLGNFWGLKSCENKTTVIQDYLRVKQKEK